LPALDDPDRSESKRSPSDFEHIFPLHRRAQECVRHTVPVAALQAADSPRSNAGEEHVRLLSEVARRCVDA
jgi:hypothetical protein